MGSPGEPSDLTMSYTERSSSRWLAFKFTNNTVAIKHEEFIFCSIWLSDLSKVQVQGNPYIKPLYLKEVELENVLL